jgi:predicted RNase H-like HicB family nuclease
MELKYLINLEKNENGVYTVTVPALPGCITQGDTWEEAVANAQEAILGYIESIKEARAEYDTGKVLSHKEVYNKSSNKIKRRDL